MQAILVERPGPRSALRLGEAPLPQPGPGQLRVRVHAVGLNPADYQLAHYGHPAWRYPHVLGLDAAGTIDALGEGVTAWRPGEAVYYHGDLSRPGCFAEYALVAAHVVAPLPARLSFPQAAALPCAGFTAYQALHRRLHVQAGQTVLVQGGAGGVGGFAVQLAAHAGLRVITTASPRNFDWVRPLAARRVRGKLVAAILQ